MKKSRKYAVFCLFISMGLMLSVVSAVSQAGKGKQGNSGSNNSESSSFLDQLTEEQREALLMLIDKLKESGATPERIREAVMQFLREHGIDVDPYQLQEFFRQQGIDEDESEGKKSQEKAQRGPLANQLTEEQMEELQHLIQELKESGAPPERIREAVMQFLREHGIDVDPYQLQEFFRQQGIDEDESEGKKSQEKAQRGPLANQLTEEQMEELQHLIQELKESGAPPERIREAVMHFLREHGIDVDPVQLRLFFREQGIDGDQIENKGPVRKMLNQGPLAHQLTEEQMEELLQLIEDLKNSHATPERIRNAVMQFLRQQGINIDPVQLRLFFREQGIDVQVPQ